MPQLRMLREQSPLTFGVAVGVPPDHTKRPAFTIAVGDGTGRVDAEATFRLPRGDIIDLGDVLRTAWGEWWYGNPVNVPQATENALRDLGLLGANVRLL